MELVDVLERAVDRAGVLSVVSETGAQEVGELVLIYERNEVSLDASVKRYN